MGYTHYWRVSNAPKGQASQTEANYQLAVRQCQRIIKAYNAACKAKDEKHPNRLSGYSAHTKVAQYGGINFNGVADLSHEDFALREHFSENEGFNFCKTARKPYDVVVTACLITLKHYLGDLVQVSSDGNAKDWTQGLKLATKVLGVKGLENPIQDKAA